MVTLQIWKNWGWPHPDVELGINFEWGKRPFKPQISNLEAFVVFVAFIVLKSVAELYFDGQEVEEAKVLGIDLRC